ncbi:MAG: hypothetical protein WAU23_15380 [Ferruginibacter sp.]
MKIEQLLVQHFYNCREITLQGMGTFTLSPDFVMPKDSEREFEIPDNAISFQYNSRATADDALIDFIVQQTRKMKALAAADLDSYLVLGKQFLNIGKPFKIEGIGMLVNNQKGELEFKIGHSFHARPESIPADLKEKNPNPDISFASDPKPGGGNRKLLLITALFVGLGLITTTIWYFFIKKNNSEPVVTVTPVVKIDSAKTTQLPADTSALVTVKPIPAADRYSFKVVFLVTKDSAAAVARMNVLTNRNHQVIMYKHDSATFRLAEPFTRPLSDTTLVKDSLNSFYYSGRGFIELE